MMKKLRLWMMAVVLCAGLFVGLEASAETMYVYDQADLLTEKEEEKLQDYAEIMKEVWEMNFLIVTTDDAQGKSSMEYADDFYDAHFPEESEIDGMAYLIDMDNREIYLSTSGIAIRYLTDDRIEKVLDEAFACVAEGDYYGTFEAFFDESEKFLYKGIPEDQYNYDIDTGEVDYYEEPMKLTFGEFLFAFVAGLIPAGITIGVIKAKYQLKFEDFHYDAYTASNVNLSTKSDHLINTFVTHRRIPKNDGHSGGSGGGGSRSSVHTSSSGRSHGGGGRSF
jgi:uncharacterized protein